MEADWILRFVFLGIAHWALAGLMIDDLAKREKVFGGRKMPWGVVIIFLTCVGSILYLLFHPQILAPGERRRSRRKK